eukprot:4358339-Pleurochrysis_carterae.AAC.3
MNAYANFCTRFCIRKCHVVSHRPRSSLRFTKREILQRTQTTKRNTEGEGEGERKRRGGERKRGGRRERGNEKG